MSFRLRAKLLAFTLILSVGCNTQSCQESVAEFIINIYSGLVAEELDVWGPSENPLPQILQNAGFIKVVPADGSIVKTKGTFKVRITLLGRGGFRADEDEIVVGGPMVDTSVSRVYLRAGNEYYYPICKAGCVSRVQGHTQIELLFEDLPEAFGREANDAIYLRAPNGTFFQSEDNVNFNYIDILEYRELDLTYFSAGFYLDEEEDTVAPFLVDSSFYHFNRDAYPPSYPQWYKFSENMGRVTLYYDAVNAPNDTADDFLIRPTPDLTNYAMTENGNLLLDKEYKAYLVSADDPFDWISFPPSVDKAGNPFADVPTYLVSFFLSLSGRFWCEVTEFFTFFTFGLFTCPEDFEFIKGGIPGTKSFNFKTSPFRIKLHEIPAQRQPWFPFRGDETQASLLNLELRGFWYPEIELDPEGRIKYYGNMCLGEAGVCAASPDDPTDIRDISWEVNSWKFSLRKVLDNTDLGGEWYFAKTVVNPDTGEEERLHVPRKDLVGEMSAILENNELESNWFTSFLDVYGGGKQVFPFREPLTITWIASLLQNEEIDLQDKQTLIDTLLNSPDTFTVPGPGKYELKISARGAGGLVGEDVIGFQVTSHPIKSTFLPGVGGEYSITGLLHENLDLLKGTLLISDSFDTNLPSLANIDELPVGSERWGFELTRLIRTILFPPTYLSVSPLVLGFNTNYFDLDVERVRNSVLLEQGKEASILFGATMRNLKEFIAKVTGNLEKYIFKYDEFLGRIEPVVKKGNVLLGSSESEDCKEENEYLGGFIDENLVVNFSDAEGEIPLLNLFLSSGGTQFIDFETYNNPKTITIPRGKRSNYDHDFSTKVVLLPDLDSEMNIDIFQVQEIDHDNDPLTFTWHVIPACNIGKTSYQELSSAPVCAKANSEGKWEIVDSIGECTNVEFWPLYHETSFWAHQHAQEANEETTCKIFRQAMVAPTIRWENGFGGHYLDLAVPVKIDFSSGIIQISSTSTSQWFATAYSIQAFFAGWFDTAVLGGLLAGGTKEFDLSNATFDGNLLLRLEIIELEDDSIPYSGKTVTLKVVDLDVRGNMESANFLVNYFAADLLAFDSYRTRMLVCSLNETFSDPEITASLSSMIPFLMTARTDYMLKGWPVPVRDFSISSGGPSFNYYSGVFSGLQEKYHDINPIAP